MKWLFLRWLANPIPLFIGLCISISGANAQVKSGAYLGELSWKEAERAIKQAPLVIIPFGAGAKQHGLHLPMDADRQVMEYLVAEAVKSQQVIATPPILHGWFPAFRDYPGTEISNPDVFANYIHEIARSVVRQGAKRIVFLNTGIFKATGLPIAVVAREIRVNTGVPTLVVSWDDLETQEATRHTQQSSGGHADEVETSIYLFLQSEKVEMNLARKDYRQDLKKSYGGYQPGLFSRDSWDTHFSESGTSGDPTIATAEKGEKILRAMTQEWLKILAGFSQYPLSKNSGNKKE